MKIDFTDILIGEHRCALCNIALPLEREIDEMFFCNKCNQFRHQLPPDYTIEQLRIELASYKLLPFSDD